MKKIVEPSEILVYDSDEENYVDFIKYKVPLKYSYFCDIMSGSCDSAGYLYDTNFKTLNEYVESLRNEFLTSLEKDVQTLLNDSYYESTNDLALMYHKIAKQYYEEYDKLNGTGYRKFFKSEIAKKYNNFLKEHSFLIEGEKRWLDKRFFGESYVKKEDRNGEIVKIITIKEPKLFNKNEFIESVNKAKQGLISNHERNLSIMIDEFQEDYNYFMEEAKRLLSLHPRVGLISVKTKGNVAEINNLSLDDFTIDDFLKIKPKIIYRFAK